METISQTFDFGRFGKCLMRELKLNGKAWLLRMLLMFGVTTILLIIATHPHHISPEAYGALQSDRSFLIFRFCGFVFCGLGASLFMENMTTNGLRLNSIMSPASQLEKFASRFVICIIFVAAAYILCYMLADVMRVLYVRFEYGELPGLRVLGLNSMREMAESEWNFWGFFFARQMTFMLGSTVWPKNSFLKTFVIAFVFISTSILSALCPEPQHWTGNTAIHTINEVSNFIPFCWGVFCLITSYYRFKESEIINRF